MVMFLRKRLSSLSAKSKKIISGVLVAVMVAGSVIAGTSLKAGAYSKTQDVLDELLGAAKPYGVVADEFKNANHNQTCFATNNLVHNRPVAECLAGYECGNNLYQKF